MNDVPARRVAVVALTIEIQDIELMKPYGIAMGSPKMKAMKIKYRLVGGKA